MPSDYLVSVSVQLLLKAESDTCLPEAVACWPAAFGQRERLAAIGPECVKTLSYLACFSPLLLGVAISRLFTTISAGNASERV